MIGATIPVNELSAQLVTSSRPAGVDSEGSAERLRPVAMSSFDLWRISGPVRAITPKVASRTTTELTSCERATWPSSRAFSRRLPVGFSVLLP